ALLELPLDDLADERWDETVAAVVQQVEPARPPRRLLTAAREAFSRHGYDAASVEEITTGARLAKGSFYRYFDNKEDAFLAAARSIVDVINDGLDTRSGTVSPHEAIEKLAELLAPVVPLFLEVVLRALHGQAKHAEVVAEIIAGVGSG